MSEAKTRRKPKAAAAQPPIVIPANVDALMDVRQVMAALAVKPTTFAKVRHMGEFPAPHARIGDRPRWLASSINRFIAGWDGTIG